MAYLDGIRAVVFDAVGTVIHPEPPALEMYRELAARHDIMLSPEEVRTRFVRAYRIEEQHDREHGWVTSEAREEHRWRTIIEETLPELSAHRDCFEELYRHFALPHAWTLEPGLDLLLDGLHQRGIAFGLGSNYDSRLETVIAGHPVLQRLRPNVVISAAVGIRKPAPGFFQAVQRQMGELPAEAILFVGDDIDNDYQGATAAGMKPILLDPRQRAGTITNRVQQLLEILH